MNKSFWKAALIRAIRTVAQAALAMIPAAATLADVNWLTVLSTAALAGVVSVLTSIATGLPEAQIEERKPPDEDACPITVKAYTDYDEDGSPVVDGGGEDA
jgi:uncharacterized protein (DUF58 family)